VTESVFADIVDRSFPYRYHGTIVVGTLVGGAPSDPNVARGWLETKLKGTTTEEQIQKMVAELMLERKITADEALDEVNKRKNVNGFKRGVEKDSFGLPAEVGLDTVRPGMDGVLFYEARQLKAALKEAVSVAVGAGKIKQQGWGTTRKWISGFFPEHVFIREEKLYLKDRNGLYITEPTDVLQQFVHTRFGSSIQYQEFVTDAHFDFTVVADHWFSDEDWAMIWTTGEMNGLGASRSQGYGTYKVTKWEKDFTKEGEASVKKLEKAASDEDMVVKTKKKAA
jgi:hypothetical protein